MRRTSVIVGSVVVVLVISFFVFSSTWDQTRTAEVQAWLDAPVVEYDPTHPLHVWLSEFDVDPVECTTAERSCFQSHADAQLVDEGDYEPLLDALEHPQTFSFNTQINERASYGTILIEANNYLLSRIAARAPEYPQNLLGRFLDAHRKFSREAPTLLDRMIATGTIGQVLDAISYAAIEFPHQQQKIELLTQAETSMRNTFIGEFQFGASQLLAATDQGPNLLYKRELTVNQLWQVYHEQVAASERTASSDQPRNAKAPWYSYILNPVGHTLAEVARPAYPEYLDSVRRLAFRIALTNALIDGEPLESWVSPIEGWRAKFNADSGELCLAPNENLALKPMCVESRHPNADSSPSTT